MQEEDEEGRRPMFRKSENQPSSRSAGAPEDSHPFPLSVRSLRQRKEEE